MGTIRLNDGRGPSQCSVLCAVLLCAPLACGPGAGSVEGETDGGDDDQSTQGDPSIGSTGMDSTDGGSDAAPDDAAADSESGGEPVCGNGVVDPGEACDDDSTSCLDDCTFTCDVVLGFTMQPGPVGTTDIGVARPIALADGTGFLVPDTNSTNRYDRDGEVVWRRSEALAPFVISVLPSQDSDAHFWAAASNDANEVTLGLFETATGETVDVAAFPQTMTTGSIGYSSTGELLQLMETTSVDGPSALVRALDGGLQEQWRAELTRVPIGEVERVYSLAIAEDGAIYLGGLNSTEGPFTSKPWVVKLAPDGELLWDRLVFQSDPIVGEDFAGSAEVAALGNDVIVTARHQHGMTSYIGSLPYFETRVLRLDAEGEILWEEDLSDQVVDGRIEVSRAMTLSADRVAVAAALDVDGYGQGWLGIIDGDGTLQCQSAMEPDPTAETRISELFRDVDGSIGMLGSRSTENTVPGYVVDRFIAFAGE